MTEVREMTRDQIARLLARQWYGHLGLARDGHPYVVPMSYAYDGGELFFITTEGTKTEFIAANHEVCFQVEDVAGPDEWQSVMLTGRAELLSDPQDVERAMFIISERNPSLSPALSHTKIGAWTRLSRIAVYRLRPQASYGRQAGAAAGG